jgi:hypothetical protein
MGEMNYHTETTMGREIEDMGNYRTLGMEWRVTAIARERKPHAPVLGYVFLAPVWFIC